MPLLSRRRQRRGRPNRRSTRHSCRHRALSLVLAIAFLAAGASATSAAQSGPVDASLTPAGPLHGPVLPGTPGRRSPGPANLVPPPRDLWDLPAWLDYRTRNHLVALPLEARLFYRQGVMAARAGSRDEAVRFVRGAGELDPSFVAPHLTLASWLLLREPSQALLQYASVIELARQNFLLQTALAGNALYLAFQSLLLGLLAAALIVIGLRNRELRHAWVEQIGRFTAPASARGWGWALLLLPFACGFGLALPAVLMLGLLWPSLKAGERSVFAALLAMLVAAPWAVGSLDRLALPLREDRPPFYGVAMVATASPSQDAHRELTALARRHPDDPFLQFADAWAAGRRGDLVAAEAGYRRALRLWPDDDRVLNNLGNTLAMQGRVDEALESYQRAGAVNPGNAAAAFNASQIYTQRFDYHAATDALSHAAALNFDLVKTSQSQATDDGALPLVDEWISPRAFWSALSRQPGGTVQRGAVPPAWRACVECSGWPFSLTALVLSLLAVLVGAHSHRRIPLRACTNCGAIVCRRCARRRRESAVCPACAAIEARAETPEFGRVLLLQHRRHLGRSRRMVRTALAVLIPGYGLLAFRRLVSPVLLLAASAALLAVSVGLATPYSFETRFALPGQEVPPTLLAGAWILVYSISILGYLSLQLRADAKEAAQAAPVRSRIRLSSRDHSARAA